MLLINAPQAPLVVSRTAAAAPRQGTSRGRRRCSAQQRDDANRGPCTHSTHRRPVLSASLAAWLAAAAAPSQAVQGLTPGRLPGVSGKPDEEGFVLYRRPQGKSGGHGVGWSEIGRYQFRVPDTWTETPVSIADLGGTEIDLRYGSPNEGQLEVVVAPVLRFADVGYNANVRIEELGPPDRIIAGFAPELFGSPLAEDDVLDTEVENRDGLTFYQWSLRKNRLVAATAYKNRCFLIAISANPRQWRKAEDKLRRIQKTFTIVDTA